MASILAISCKEGASNPPGDKSPAPAAAPEIAPPDAQRMVADIEVLSTDEMAGRYTLSPEIDRAAKLVAERYAELGIAPYGEDYRHGFSLRIGAELDGEQSLALGKGRKPKAVSAEDFRPLAVSGNGEVEGEVVFVGYAAKAKGIPAQEADEEAGEEAKPAVPEYDDLEGVDLKGKVALMLLYAPNSPDLRALFTRMQEISNEFAATAKPLVEAKDEAGMAKLHDQARRDLASLIEPFMSGAQMPDSFFEVADPMVGELDLMKLLRPVMAMARDRQQFDPKDNRLSAKLERLKEAGAVGVIAVQGPRSFVGADARDEDALRELVGDGLAPDPVDFPVVQVRHKAAEKLFRGGKLKLSKAQAKIDKTMRPASKALGIEAKVSTSLTSKEVDAPNVLATIPGTDLADEFVILGGHLDHIGTADEGQCSEQERKGEVDRICNGADDNASGTAMIMEVARVIQASDWKPRRTLVFAHFAGEELGLLGSEALVESPPFPLDKVEAMVNLDMVGRLGARGLAIGGVKSSEAWMPMLDEIGNAGMPVLYEGAISGRSDHANFYKKDIPVLFFFTGVHPDYHRPRDHVEEINVEGMAKIGSIVSQVVQRVGEGETLGFTSAGDAEDIGGGLPGDDPETVVKRVDAEGNLVED